MIRELEDVGESLVGMRKSRKRKRVDGEFEERQEEDVGFESDNVGEAVESQSLDGNADGRIGFEAVEASRKEETGGKEAGDEVEGRLKVSGWERKQREG